MRLPKNIDDWQPKHFLHEASRVLEEQDLGCDSVVHGAMMLAALREGAHLNIIAGALGIDRDRLEPGFDRLVRSGVFRKDGKVCGAEWLNEDDGGLAFVLDVAVADGLLEKSKSRSRSRKVGAAKGAQP